MPNPYNVPEIDPAELAEKRANGAEMHLVDVREAQELRMANFGDGVLHVPMSAIAQRRLDALPPELANQEVEVVIFCHHGIRSAQVCAFLRAQGWQNVLNLRGGIDAYAREVDPSVGMY